MHGSSYTYSVTRFPKREMLPRFPKRGRVLRFRNGTMLKGQSHEPSSCPGRFNITNKLYDIVPRRGGVVPPGDNIFSERDNITLKDTIKILKGTVQRDFNFVF